MAAPDPSDSDGIVLQFAKTKSNHVSARNQVTKEILNESLIQLSPASTGSASNIMYGATHSLSEQGVEWMKSEESQTRLQATRSLSAVKRKEQHKMSIDGREICDMDEILQVLKMENESLTNLHVHMDSNPQLADDKSGDLNKDITTSNVMENSSSIELEGATNSVSSAVENVVPRIRGSLLPSLPFKPVLVNRYKQATVTAKTLTRPREVTPKTPTSPAREEENTTDLQHRQTQASSEAGGKEIVRESLTEHTVKVITDKVRQMDAR